MIIKLIETKCKKLKANAKNLKKVNHLKGWDTKLLAYVLNSRDKVAGLPGECSTFKVLDFARLN